jgi:hypothetical protein
MSRLSVMPESERPSANELRLGKKVVDLEKERDAMAVSCSRYHIGSLADCKAEIQALKAKYAPSTSTTIPVPVPLASTSTSTSDEKIEIPHALLPVLDVMRHHISELTRDNQAMRFTFGLESSSIATSSKITLDSPHPVVHNGLDLNAVVKRVRELVRRMRSWGIWCWKLGRLILKSGNLLWKVNSG